jgi:murein DD-endopeptidase MepM/ murein hydrolase activator NlpD
MTFLKIEKTKGRLNVQSDPLNTDFINMSALNDYSLPVPKKKLQRIDRTSSPAHVGKLRNAVDFIVAENTPVLAAADGVVTSVKDDSHIGGPSIEYWHYSNFIVIQHSNEEYSRYDHLAHRSATVRAGQHVKRGQVIARVGTTGFTYLPHLHFHIFIFIGGNIWTDFDTLTVTEFLS